MNEYQFAMLVYTILIISLGIRAIVQISTARTVAAHSQPKPSAFPVPARLINGKQSSLDNKRILSMSKQVKFRKIPLKILIETLVHIHNSGADYIDILGIEDEVQDIVTIAVEEEYMSNDNDAPDDVNFINDKLSDDDINDLMI